MITTRPRYSPTAPTNSNNTRIANTQWVKSVSASLSSNTFTGLQSFSGTDSPGLQLKSLTSAQITALGAIGNGSILIDSTTNRVDVRLNGVTEELIDTRGGQTINGALTVGNTIQLWNASANVAIRIGTYVQDFGSISFANTAPTASTVTLWGNANNTAVVLNTADFTYFRRQNATQFQISSGGVEFVSNIGLASNTVLAFSSTTDPTAAKDFSITRSSAGVGRLGNGGANALGSLNLTNLTASGTVTATAPNASTQAGIFRAAVSSNFDVVQVQNSAGVSRASIRLFDDANSIITASTFNDPADRMEFNCRASAPLLNLNSTGQIRISSTSLAYGAADVSLSRASVNVWQIGNGTNNALGSLNLTNLTASGTVTALEQTFNNGANSTRVARATGTTGRLQIYRPNDPATVSVEFGGGNDEIRIRGGLGTLNHTGALFQIASAAAMSIGCTGALTLLSNGSTAQTITGTNTVFGGLIQLGTFTVGTLPSAAANTRARAFVTDSNLAFNSTNLGSTVTAGGSTLVPVFSNGTNWVIG